MITRCDAYQNLCKYKNINPRSRQRQLKSSFVKTLFESKNAKNIIYNIIILYIIFIYNNNIYMYIYINI